MPGFSEVRGAIAGWCARQTGESQIDRLQRVLVAAVVLLFPAACLLVDRSDSLSLLLLTVIGISVWIRNGFKSGLTRRDWLYVAVFIGFFLVGVLSYELGRHTVNGFHLLGRYIRFLLVLPALLALRHYRPPAPAVWAGLGLAALVLGLDAVWESVMAGGFLRPDGDTNVAILFGDLATLTTFLFAAGYIYIDARLPRHGPILVMACVLMGLLASFLSGTRGAWIAVPVLLVLFLTCRHLLQPRIVLAGSAVAIVLFIGFFLLPQTHVRERLANAYSQIRVYLASREEVEPSAGSPVCMQDPVLLAGWAGLARIQSGSQVRLMVTTNFIPAYAVGSGCNEQSALMVENLGDTTARVKLQHSVRSGTKLSDLHIMVAGGAYVGFGSGTWTRVGTGPRSFVRLDLSADRELGDFVTLTLWSHAKVWVVPLETYPGEYRYVLSDTSIGQRLKMWAVAWRLFLGAPVTGVGSGAYQAVTHDLVVSGAVPEDIGDFDHPHSDYFDALSGRGLLGLLALLMLLGVPVWLYTRNLDSRDPHCMGAALAGVLVIAGFAVFALTETMFTHSVTIGWYVIMTAIFLVSADAPGGQWTDKR